MKQAENESQISVSVTEGETIPHKSHRALLLISAALVCVGALAFFALRGFGPGGHQTMPVVSQPANQPATIAGAKMISLSGFPERIISASYCSLTALDLNRLLFAISDSTDGSSIQSNLFVYDLAKDKITAVENSFRVTSNITKLQDGRLFYMSSHNDGLYFVYLKNDLALEKTVKVPDFLFTGAGAQSIGTVFIPSPDGSRVAVNRSDGVLILEGDFLNAKPVLQKQEKQQGQADEENYNMSGWLSNSELLYFKYQKGTGIGSQKKFTGFGILDLNGENSQTFDAEYEWLTADKNGNLFVSRQEQGVCEFGPFNRRTGSAKNILPEGIRPELGYFGERSCFVYRAAGLNMPLNVVNWATGKTVKSLKIGSGKIRCGCFLDDDRYYAFLFSRTGYPNDKTLALYLVKLK